jgi:hypothetical protein
LRAFVLEGGVDVERIVRAVASEVESHARDNGGLKDAILFLEVRRCADEPKINGTAPQRKVRSR